jgi:hypothetical protein
VPTIARTALLGALLLALLASCSQKRVRNAPFRDRPDSVAAGKLVGPFDGRVVDAATGDPVPGALVYASWSFRSGTGLTTPAGFHEEVTSTDASGRYRIRDLLAVPKDADKHPAVAAWRASRGAVRLTDFHLVIYKRGYVAYRSDRRFSDLGPRRDFTQTRNEITLERWRSDYSHARHLRYVGGGPALAALVAWEVDDAAAELSGLRSVGPQVATDLFAGKRPRRIAAAQLVTQKDLQEITGFDGTFETGPLGDEPDTEQYSSQHFQAVGLPQAYDLAIRLWVVGRAEAQKRYGRLVDDLPGVDERDEVGDRSLRAEEQAFVGFAFFDGKRGAVVLLTCGKALCDSMDEIVKLAERAFERIDRLAPGEEPAEAPAPAQAPTPVPSPVPGEDSRREETP